MHSGMENKTRQQSWEQKKQEGFIMVLHASSWWFEPRFRWFGGVGRRYVHPRSLRILWRPDANTTDYLNLLWTMS